MGSVGHKTAVAHPTPTDEDKLSPLVSDTAAIDAVAAAAFTWQDDLHLSCNEPKEQQPAAENYPGYISPFERSAAPRYT